MTANAATLHATSTPEASREAGHAPPGRAAMWWVIASEVVIFGGFIACYLLYRIRHPEWSEAASHTSTWLGALNTLILATSSLSMARAQEAAERGRADRASHLVAFTMLLAAAFLCVKSAEYILKVNHGIAPGTHLFWGFYFGMTGLHALHIIAGFIAMAALHPELDRGRNLHRVEMVGLYWHLVDVVWIFLFALLYVVK